MKNIGWISVAITGATAALYFAITRTGIPPGTKWTLFGAHILLAGLGLVSGTLAMKRRQWIGTISIIGSAYYLWLQLLT